MDKSSKRVVARGMIALALAVVLLVGGRWPVELVGAVSLPAVDVRIAVSVSPHASQPKRTGGWRLKKRGGRPSAPARSRRLRH